MKIMNTLFRVALFCSFLIMPFLSKAQSFPCNGGMADNFPCLNVDLKAHIPITDLLNENGNDIWGWTSPDTGKEYAIVGTLNNTVFFDITDSENPIKIATLAGNGGAATQRDMKVIDNVVYIGNESSNHQIQVYDLTLLESMTGTDNIVDDNDVNIATINNTGNSHNIVVNEESKTLYSVGTRSQYGGGLVFYDAISDPLNPTQIGGFEADGYTHDAVCFVYKGTDLEHIGKEICIGLNEDTYTIVDVTDKTNPIQISRTGYANHVYTHQGWVTDDHKYLIVNDEIDEVNNGHNTRTLIFDISDLDSPQNHQAYLHSTAASDHNLYIRGSYVYQANYRAGMRILDISDLDAGNIAEAGFFDVHPDSDDLGYYGAWTAFPYFNSDKVIINTRNEGMFIVEPQLPHFVVNKKGYGVKYTRPGETVSYPLDILGFSGLDEAVTIQVSGQPTGGVAPTFTVSPHTGSSTILNIDVPLGAADGNYSILLEATAPNSPPHRLRMGLIVDSALPFALTNFTAKEQKNVNLLEWNTVDEEHTKKHIIERSMDGKNKWEVIGEVIAIGMEGQLSQYQWADKTPLSTSYYRLCTKSKDGSNSYSPIVSVNRIVEKDMLVYPNPTRNLILIQYNSEVDEQSILQLVDPLGKEVQQMDWSLVKGLNYQQVFLQHLPVGIYYLKLNGETLEKIIKN